ncbi:hypothetical protein [Saccharospirillum impatiens]|uniref:hypothetical protein n=1 Tax=Saccharospirillum impatiens TaxID=169438 RepID=UPI000490ABEC|nr:hypothetical protein [Saccharospirillum impatiens]
MRELIEIVIKVFAAYLVFSTVGGYAPLALVTDAFSGPNSPYIGFLAAGVSVPIGIGIILWFRAPKISKAALPSDEPGPIVPESGVVAAGVFLIGVYWFVRSSSVLLTQLSSQASLNYGWFAVMALSLALILGSDLMAKVFRKLRTAGTNA